MDIVPRPDESAGPARSAHENALHFRDALRRGRDLARGDLVPQGKGGEGSGGGSYVHHLPVQAQGRLHHAGNTDVL